MQGGVTFAAGIEGQAFNFNGSSMAVWLGSPAALQLQNFTIEAWVKRASATQATVSGLGAGEIFGYDNNGYAFGMLDNGTLVLSKVNVDGVFGEQRITDTAFHHLAVTRSGSTVIFYVDGVGIAAPDYGAQFTFETPVAIGSLGGGSNNFWGMIDEVSVYARPLAADEILAIYNTKAAGKCSGTNRPSITTPPADTIVAQGNSAGLGVAANGSRPLSYQWQLNGTNIPGATSAFFNIPYARLSDAGNYVVVISNAFGSTNSRVAVLNVTNPACTPPPAGLVSWWKGEGDAADLMGTNNGVIKGSVTFAPGKVGQAFSFDGNGGRIYLGEPVSVALQNFTIEAWIRRGSASQASQNAFFGVIFGFADLGYDFGLYNDGALVFSAVDYQVVLSSQRITDTLFHHVAVVCNSGQVSFYVDGVGAPPQPLFFSFQFYTTAAIGSSSDGGFGFLGLIDEFSIYNRALSSAEIQAIYNAPDAGKCMGAAPPSITGQPTPQSATIGNNATLTVHADGGRPLHYQWRLNGTNIDGATGSTLQLLNVQTTNAGFYSVNVFNGYGSTNSIEVILKVPPPSCLPAPDCLVGWWRGENDSGDSGPGNSDGAISGNVTYVPGRVGQAFSFAGAGGAMIVSNTASLQLQDFTIEAWIKRGNPSTASLSSSVGQIFCFGNGGYDFGLSDLGFLVLGQVNVTGVYSPYGGPAVTDTAFHHVAVTRGGSTVYFYIDGLGVQGPDFDRQFQFTPTAAIGATADGSSVFLGLIDEVSIYNRALTLEEIQAAYSAGNAGKCLTAPVIAAQPVGQSVTIGNNTFLSVVATGTKPFNYQWQLNGTNLPGETGPALNFINAQITNAGPYTVVISNVVGVTNSSTVMLTVSNPTCIPAPPGLVSWWRGEGGPDDIAGGNLGVLQGGTTFVPGNVGQGFNFDGSTGRIFLGTATNLQLQTFTFEAWIRRASATQASQSGVLGDILAYGNGGYVFSVTANGALLLGQAGGGGTTVSHKVVDTNLHHVAVTRNGSTVVFYMDGVAYVAPAFGSQFQFSTPVAIGASVNGGYFWGLVDEISVYNRALSAAEIQNIYNANSAGKCPGSLPPSIKFQPQGAVIAAGGSISMSVVAGGTAPFNYQWQFNGSNIDLATNAALLVTNAPLTAQGNYSAVVSNSFASATSSNAFVTVLRSNPRFDTSQGGTAYTSGGFRINLLDLSGHGPVIIYASTNLTDWQPIATNPATLGAMSFQDLESTNLPTRFYRAVER